ncbi:MAG: hypothetical protein KUG79_07890, partial [Pseudomonadales bacterium]|nr:hypothetical protein [Pseudomonadales bacterium]
YISIIGRDKDMIITGGLNVYPKEIEILLDDIPGIKESAVIGLPDADFGEAVTAVIVLEENIALEDKTVLEENTDLNPGILHKGQITDNTNFNRTSLNNSATFNSNEKFIIHYLKAKIAGFKVAKKVFFIDALPRNTMGKVQKNLLREKYRISPI